MTLVVTLPLFQSLDSKHKDAHKKQPLSLASYIYSCAIVVTYNWLTSIKGMTFFFKEKSQKADFDIHYILLQKSDDDYKVVTENNVR